MKGWTEMFVCDFLTYYTACSCLQVYCLYIAFNLLFCRFSGQEKHRISSQTHPKWVPHHWAHSGGRRVLRRVAVTWSSPWKLPWPLWYKIPATQWRSLDPGSFSGLRSSWVKRVNYEKKLNTDWPGNFFFFFFQLMGPACLILSMMVKTNLKCIYWQMFAQ